MDNKILKIDSKKFDKASNSYVISIYNDEIADETFAAEMLRKLLGCFPDVREALFKPLLDRVIANKFTRKRIEDAVNNVIDTHKYKTFTIADVISYDKYIPIYSYVDICNIAYDSGRDVRDNFKEIIIDN